MSLMRLVPGRLYDICPKYVPCPLCLRCSEGHIMDPVCRHCEYEHCMTYEIQPCICQLNAKQNTPIYDKTEYVLREANYKEKVLADYEKEQEQEKREAATQDLLRKLSGERFTDVRPL